MFEIRMYRGFSKKLNSTKIPVETEVSKRTYQCYFLDAQSIMNPVIVIEDTQDNSAIMMEFTYAYIPSLKRYYFISNNVVIDNRRWVYYLQVDVLASFKSDIINSRQYVIRSTSMFNDYITDTMYPTVPMSNNDRYSMQYKAGNTVQAYNGKTGSWDNIDFFNNTYENGAVIFGVTGQGNVSVSYYVSTVAEFKAFINRVVTANPTGYSWGNLPTGVQATLSNLMQYITFAKWIPFMPLSANLGGAITSVNLGSTSININGYKVTAGLSNQTCKFTLSIPNHPLYSRHGYYNLLPYREVSLFFLPIGVIPIDPTKIWQVSTLYIKFIVDLTSCDAEFIVSTVDDDITSLDHIIYTAVTNLGVDLSLTDYSMSIEAALFAAVGSYISNAFNQARALSQSSGGGSTTHTSSAGVTHGGAGRSFAQSSGGSSIHTSSSGNTHGGLSRSLGDSVKATPTSGGGIIANINDAIQNSEIINSLAKTTYNLIGNALQPVADALGNAADFIDSSFGQVTMNGHTGSFLTYMATKPVVFCWFCKHGDEDYDRFGRPYFANARLDNLTGFCLCRNAYVEYETTKPLKPEVEGIDNLLNTGIYLE